MNKTYTLLVITAILVNITYKITKAQTYLTEDFENAFVGNPAAPSGWTQSRTLLVGNSTPSANNVNGAKDWQRNTFASGAWTISSFSGAGPVSGAQSGANCLYLQDYYFGSSSSVYGSRRIESPVMDLSASVSPYLRFWFSYGSLSSNSTYILRTMVSNNGGTTWKILMQVRNNGTNTWQRINISIPTAYRTANCKIGFELTNSYNDDIFIDNVSVQEFSPTTITSTASGSWSNAATWGGIIPDADYNVTIASGHSVTLDQTLSRCQNLTINGTLQYASTSSSQLLQVFGNLTVNNGGIYNSFFSTTGKPTYIGGSIINNGTLNFSVGSGTLWWYGSAPATYSGIGSINTFISGIRHANSGGVTYNAPVQTRGTFGLYDGVVNPNGNLTIGNSAVSTQTIEVAHGSLSSAPIWGTGVTRSTTYLDGTTYDVSPTPQTIITGEENESIAGVRTIGGTLTINTWGNVQLNYPLTVGTGTTGSLSLSRGIIINNTTNVLTINNTNSTGFFGSSGVTNTPPNYHGTYITGAIRINFGTTTSTRNFPLGVGTAFNNAGDGALPNANVSKQVALATSTAWTAGTSLTVSIEPGNPGGTVVPPLTFVTGNTKYRLNRNGGPDLPANATVNLSAINYTYGNGLNSDSLDGTPPQLAIAQSVTGTSDWTQRSAFSGSGNFVNDSYYSRTTATSSPGPVSTLAVNGEYFCFATSAPACTAPSPGNTLATANTVCSGAGFTLSLQNNQTDVGYNYQWEISDDSVVWSAIPGAVLNALTTNQTIQHYYRCNVTCSFTSNSSVSTPILIAMGCPSFTAGSTNANSSVCASTAFTVSLFGATNTCVSYQWQSSPDSVVWNNIGTNSTVSVSQTATTWYRCILTCNTGGATAISQPKKVNMVCTSINGGTTTSSSLTVCTGTSFTLNLSGSSSSCITYQWQSSTDSTTWNNIAGATSSFLSYSQAVRSFYRCRLTCDAGTLVAFSVPVKVSMTCSSLSAVTTVSTTTLSCPSATFTLSVSGLPSGSCITYNWQKSIDNINYTYLGITTSTYLTYQTYPYYYRCVLSCENGAVLSATIPVFVALDLTCGSWTQKASYSGGVRYSVSSFSIGTKGYVGLGHDGSAYKTDFWEYNPSNGSWTQKANFIATGRTFTSSFSIGAKGYVGLGSNNGYKNDFYEYDTTGNTWSQKANFGGTARTSAAAFSIGTKGYIVNGYDNTYKNDLWEYDQASNTWIQKTNFPGVARSASSAFVIGGKGYVGLGTNNTSPFYRKDFYEYDPSTNTWLQKATYPGGDKNDQTAFTLNNRGYFGLGASGGSTVGNTDVWEYDPVGNSWMKMGDFNGVGRYATSSFTIGNRAYVGLGLTSSSSGVYLNDFWEYAGDSCAGSPSSGLTLGPALVCTGTTFTLSLQNGTNGRGITYQWQKSNDSINYTNVAGGNASSLNTSITGATYFRCLVTCIKSGLSTTSTSCFVNVQCAGLPPSGVTTTSTSVTVCRNSGFTLSLTGPTLSCVQYQWQRSLDNITFTGISGSTAALIAMTQTINTYYRCKITCNNDSSLYIYSNSLRITIPCELNSPVTTVSTNPDICPSLNFTLSLSGAPSACLIYQWQSSPDNNIYTNISGATSSIYTANQTSATYYRCILSCDSGITTANSIPLLVTMSSNCGEWVQRTDIGTTGREGAVAFTINGIGYFGTGYDGAYKRDIWAYDTSTNAWTQMANFGGTARYNAVAFSIGSKGYLGTGFDGAYKSDFWEYDPGANTWTQKAAFGGSTRYAAVGFGTGGKGYIGTGYNGSYKNDFWEYTPAANSWTQKTSYPGGNRYFSSAFSIGVKGYVGCGYDGTGYKSDFYEYDPATGNWTSKASYGGGTRTGAVGLSSGAKGYLVNGYNGSYKNDFWEYDTTLNQWNQKIFYTGGTRSVAAGFTVGERIFVGTGYNGSARQKDMWEYRVPACQGTPSPGNTISSVAIACQGAGFVLSLQNVTVGSGVTYQWFTSPDNNIYYNIAGANLPTLLATQQSSAYYRCLVTCTATGLSANSAPVQVGILPAPVINISHSTPSICPPGAQVTMTATGANNFTWTPASALATTTGSTVTASPFSTTGFVVTGTGLNGCSSRAYDTISVCPAQSSQGKDFWVMFNGNYDYTDDTLIIFISSQVNTTGIISGFTFSSVPFTVTANQVTKVGLPLSLSQHTNDVIDNKGIHISALENITVYGLNNRTFSTDAFLGLPTNALGTNYMVLAYRNSSTSTLNAVQLGIVGASDGTTVTITPSVTTLSHAAGIPYSITLNQGQSYELANSTSATADLTGTIITASQSIGVFGGSRCATIPAGIPACDHLHEMLPPLNTWGERFAIVPLKSRLNGDTYRFLASENNTNISINDTVQPVLSKGQFIEQIITVNTHIESDKPILVAQYANGSNYSGSPGDPFMMLIPSLEQFLPAYTVTSLTGFEGNYINIVAPNAVVGSLTLDAVAVSSSEYTSIGSSGYSGAQITVQPGVHNLSATLPFGAFQYGFNSFNSYGYPGGQSFSQVATVASVTLTPENGSDNVGINHCWQALVKDQYGIPLQGIRVDFVSGNSNVHTGFGFTNAAGIASFCYTGINGGIDSIIAIVGTTRDTSFFIWSAGDGITLNVKLYIEGFYQGGGLMTPVMLNAAEDTSLANCDTIMVELHHATNYSFIRSDLTRINVNGNASLIYPSSYGGSSYYLVIRHRNAIETWSKNPVLFGNSIVNFDFTSPY